MEPHPVPPFNFTNIHPKNSMFQQLIDMHLYNRSARGIFKKIIFYQQAMLMDHGYILVICFPKPKFREIILQVLLNWKTPLWYSGSAGCMVL